MSRYLKTYACGCGCGQLIGKGTYARGHWNRGRREAIILSLIGYQQNGCWEWQGAISTTGYGTYGNRPYLSAHRLVYEMFVGPIPEGMHTDHLCRNPLCVNPLHIEPETARENTLRGIGPSSVNARKTHCKQGHAFDEMNTYLTRSGTRSCRACAAASMRRTRQHRRDREQAA